MFTPRTPRPFFLLLALNAGPGIVNLGKAQDVTLLPLSVYETSLVTFHARKIKTACLEYQASTKKKWWYYLPNVGLQFGLPSINARTKQLVNIDQKSGKTPLKISEPGVSRFPASTTKD